jgi:hypothetical protein
MLHIDYFEALMTKLAIRKRLTRFNLHFYIFTLKNIFIRSIPNIL